MSQPPITFPWPDTMAAARAAEYCGVSVEAINKARRDKKLQAAGRRGGNGSWTYDKAELDRWMRGQKGGRVVKQLVPPSLPPALANAAERNAGRLRMRDHTLPCPDCDLGDGPTGLEDPPLDGDACSRCCGYKELVWMAWWHEDDGECDIRDELCASRDPDADDQPLFHAWLEPDDVWACLPCYLRAHARGCGCDAFEIAAEVAMLDLAAVGGGL